MYELYFLGKLKYLILGLVALRNIFYFTVIFLHFILANIVIVSNNVTVNSCEFLP